MNCFIRLIFFYFFQFSKSLSRTPSPFKKTEDIMAAAIKIKQTIKYVTKLIILFYE